MSSNYNTLLLSENELSISFFESLDNLLKIHKYLWKNILEKKINEKLNEKINYYIEICLKSHKDILDDCIWIISKDQPRANHLRYIISMIYSVKDMDSLAKYPSKILLNFHNKIKISSEFQKLINSYLNTFEKMIILLKEKKVENTYENSKILKEKFLKSYDLFMEKSFKANTLNKEFNIEMYKIAKSLDKTVDHLFNLFENFKFIKNSNRKTNKINLKNIL